MHAATIVTGSSGRRLTCHRTAARQPYLPGRIWASDNDHGHTRYPARYLTPFARFVSERDRLATLLRSPGAVPRALLRSFRSSRRREGGSPARQRGAGASVRRRRRSDAEKARAAAELAAAAERCWRRRARRRRWRARRRRWRAAAGRRSGAGRRAMTAEVAYGGGGTRRRGIGAAEMVRRRGLEAAKMARRRGLGVPEMQLAVEKKGRRFGEVYDRWELAKLDL
ncbi:hypothetical protein PVAP13_3NG079726 [Panicum virgatum]|uniref:Uncharacterized protein n=1 Tax=Panicum virgatum TaxID=38727 RepID=A0A8T0U9W4_PANVG|nr:hypothetical protein PVAP13_3NG079726 [Panicum virgatum]